MKTTILSILLLFTALLGYSQTKNFIDQSYLETTAVVDTLVVPDKVYLSILIKEKDSKGKVSIEAQEQKMDAALKSLNINTKKQLFLSDAATNFKRYFLKRKDILKNKAYTLIVYDAQTAGKVLISLESIGISNVNLTKTEFSKIEALKLELKRKAIIKAKIQGETLLQPLNQKLGRALHISDANYKNYENQYIARSDLRVKSNLSLPKQSPIEIEFQKIKIQSSISVKFKIE